MCHFSNHVICDILVAITSIMLVRSESDAPVDCRDLAPMQRKASREEVALPILTEFRAWLDAESPRLLPKSPVGQAATYALNQWNARIRYCEDGELSIDNNASERAMKTPAPGRKN